MADPVTPLWRRHVPARVTRSLAVAFAVGALLVSLWRVEQAQSQVKDLIEQRCMDLNENRQVLRELIEFNQEPLAVPAGADPGLREAIEDANRRNVEFQKFAGPRTRPVDCSDG